MNAECQLCGATIVGPPLAELRGVSPDSPDYAMIDYDALASHMWLHISDTHRNQMEEGILAQRRAAKMYAMNWATIPADLETVRQRHRQSLIIALSVTTQFEGDKTTGETQAAAPGVSVVSSDDSEGNGSNEKKSSKNATN